MIHEEKDYNTRKIPKDGPIFLLRGSDPSSGLLAMIWRLINLDRINYTKSKSASKHASAMLKYSKGEEYGR